MPIRGSTMLPSNVTRTLVCIDQAFVAEMAGRLYNPFAEHPIEFHGVIDMATRMDRLFDALSFPQVYFDYRSFRKENTAPPARSKAKEVQRYMDDSIFETEKGQKATFIVQVQFRQNATWQGTIQWADQKKTRRFRSTPEMIKLMSDALEEESGDSVELASWEKEPENEK